ncbi:MFS general substrate transporter [Cylindrobasidium torrendii FP15055 ss-10]|uniref:MFS general substrate transporter n=1 Tax=Cylindrobasidium torrendii FP15055 ss-10 TaxID=1314674 RepID=A0A0D7BK01_9AGAR|nr:MFS general substrate transporter [Cylindrobasidium torrendii FP15055 ss-10]
MLQDRGFGAYAFLLSAWLMDMLLWGSAFSYGIFLEHYTSVEFPHAPRTTLALVGSVQTGILYLSSLVLLPVFRWYPKVKRVMMWVGFVLTLAGLVSAAFVKEPWALVLTQGVMVSVGSSILYWPVLPYMFEWFSEKKGLANGIIFSGASIGGTCLPYAIQALLQHHGRRTTLLVLALIFALLLGPVIPFAKARLPLSRVVKPGPMNFHFLSQFVFWILCTANMCQALGNYIPTLYLPSFASAMRQGDIGTTGVALYNASSAFGQILVGHFSDRFDLRLCMAICALGSSTSVLLIWGLSVASTIAPLVIFALFFGFFAPSWASLWPKFSSVVAGDDAATAMALFVGGRGIGTLLAAPISEGLLGDGWPTGNSQFAYSLAGYGPLIVFTGVTQFASVLGVMYKLFEPRTR